MAEVSQNGGWCAPTPCQMCGGAPVHDEDCALALDVQLPRVSVKRGGIHYPRFRVETMVRPARKRFLRRQTWNLHVRYWDPARKTYMNHIMEGFPAENLANNAAEIIKFTIQTINEQYNEEKRSR